MGFKLSKEGKYCTYKKTDKQTIKFRELDHFLYKLEVSLSKNKPHKYYSSLHLNVPPRVPVRRMASCFDLNRNKNGNLPTKLWKTSYDEEYRNIVERLNMYNEMLEDIDVQRNICLTSTIQQYEDDVKRLKEIFYKIILDNERHFRNDKYEQKDFISKDDEKIHIMNFNIVESEKVAQKPKKELNGVLVECINFHNVDDYLNRHEQEEWCYEEKKRNRANEQQKEISLEQYFMENISSETNSSSEDSLESNEENEISDYNDNVNSTYGGITSLQFRKVLRELKLRTAKKKPVNKKVKNSLHILNVTNPVEEQTEITKGIDNNNIFENDIKITKDMTMEKNIHDGSCEQEEFVEETSSIKEVDDLLDLTNEKLIQKNPQITRNLHEGGILQQQIEVIDDIIDINNKSEDNIYNMNKLETNDQYEISKISQQQIEVELDNMYLVKDDFDKPSKEVGSNESINYLDNIYYDQKEVSDDAISNNSIPSTSTQEDLSSSATENPRSIEPELPSTEISDEINDDVLSSNKKLKVVQECVNELKEQINRFDGDKKNDEYKNLYVTLFDCMGIVNLIKSTDTEVVNTKQDILSKVLKCIKELEKKVKPPKKLYRIGKPS